MTRISQVFHRMGSPPFFFAGAKKWAFGLYIIGIIGLLWGTIWGLFFTPPERYQGDVFRIMYIHVPTAHLSEAIYVAIAVAGAIFLVWRMKMADIFITAAVPVGCTITALALFSGIIWGIPTWGTGWVWDARTTSMLILFFLFFALMALRHAFPNRERAAYAVSILAIVGVINIPLIKYSVDWFNTLHQPASLGIGKPATIARTFLWPLFINAVALYAFVAGICLERMRTELISRESNSDWVRKAIQLNK